MNKYFRKSLYYIGLVLMFVMFSKFVPGDEVITDGYEFYGDRNEPKFLLSSGKWVDSVLNSLTLEQRIAQMIMVAAYSDGRKTNDSEVTKLVRDQKIGGLV